MTEGEASEFSDVPPLYQFDLLILIVFGLQILYCFFLCAVHMLLSKMGLQIGYSFLRIFGDRFV